MSGVMDYSVWNTLHDGVIESIQGELLGDLTLLVEISYLCAHLPTKETQLELRLRDCTRFQYEPYAGEPSAQLREIEALNGEVLSADHVDDVIVIHCAAGTLRLVYHAIEIRLLDGTIISPNELESAAVEYWTNWERRAQSDQSQ